MAFIPKILVISNLQGTSPLWGFSLKQRLNIILEANPARAIQRWAEILPDLVVFDIDSEPLAIELITKIRDEAVIPVLMLSSNRTDQFMLEAYQAGVDECILKPIQPPLFHAKLKAWLRHSWSVSVSLLYPLKIGNVKLIPSERNILFVDRDPVRLTNLELRLLFYLMARPGYVVTSEELCQRIWGYGGDGDVIRLKNVVYRLRRKIEADPAHPHYLLTVPGVGYHFEAE